MNADLIIVIKDGGILEKGNHDQLIEQKGKYYQLWSKQMKTDGPKPGIDQKELTMVNDLSPKSREEELKKALQKTGARFHGSELNIDDKKSDGGFPLASQSAPAVFLKSHRKVEAGPPVATQTNGHAIVKPANANPIVSFALGEPNSLSKSQESQFRTQSYSRTISPTQSVLKSIDATRQPDKRPPSSSRPVTPKLSSSLKPDAREFVPSESAAKEYSSIPEQIQVGFTPMNSFATRAQDGKNVPTTAPASKNVDRKLGREVDPREEYEKRDKGNLDKVQEKIDKALKISEEKVKELEVKRAETIAEAQRHHSNYEVRPEAIQDEQPSSPTDTQPEAELRKKRRRSRRRSNKSKSLMEEQDGGVIVTEFPEAFPIAAVPAESDSRPPMVNLSPRPMDDARLSNIDGESSNITASAVDKRPKRRFRSKSGGKPQGSMIEPENQEPVPYRVPTPPTEAYSRQYKGKRASSFIEGDYRTASREDTRPIARASTQSSTPGQPEAPTSTTPLLPKGSLHEQGRRKTWGKSYGSRANGNGNWRSRADNDGLNEGLAGISRKPSADATGT